MPVLLIVRAGDKNKPFSLQNKRIITVPKQESGYNRKSSNKAQKLLTYSD